MKRTATVTSDGPEIDLQIVCEASGLPDRAALTRWLASAIEAIDCEPNPEISIRIVGEEESRTLNREFRGRDKATNVLSFPSELENLPGLPADNVSHMGDLVLCAPVVAREAQAQDKAERAHWMHLILHGFLHLNGYDHESEEEAAAMENVEIRLLQAIGLPDPYKDMDSS